jgi:hypothetical protein
MAEVTQTKAERYTQQLEDRAIETLKRDYPNLCSSDTHERPDIEWIVKFERLEFLRAKPIKKDKTSKKKDAYLYLVWDGREFTIFDIIEDAIVHFSANIRESSIKQRLLFVSSPLIVSGLLAFGLLVLLATLSLNGQGVPSQLWSIFTAVVAFYFGREGWTAMRREMDHEA